MSFIEDALTAGAVVVVAKWLLGNHLRRVDNQLAECDAVLADLRDCPTVSATTPHQLLGNAARPDVPPQRRLFRFR